MASTSLSSSRCSSVLDDPSNPLYLHHEESPRAMLVYQPLVGENYPTWERSMRMALIAKNKLGFIDGTLTLSSPMVKTSSAIQAWIRCNKMVASWILNSVSQEIAASIVYKDTALEIWNDLRERLSQANGPRVFQLQKDIAFTNNETHMTNNVIQPAAHSTSMAEFVANNSELGSPTISEERIPSLVEYSFTPSAKLDSVSSVLYGTNPIPANNSYTDANGARSLSISSLFPPAMSEIETDDSCSESNETPRAVAQFSYSISSYFPPGRSETDSNSEIYEIIPTDPSSTASPGRTATFKEILKPKSSNNSKSNRTPPKFTHSKKNSILSLFFAAMSLTNRSKRPRHTFLTTRFKGLEIIDREKFPLKMLLEATNNFSEDRMIETDYFGQMYHAILDDGREVTIHRAEISMSEQFVNEFLRGVEAGSRLDHKNVVRLLGFCEDGKDGLLVSEYMRYGTLHWHLHNPERSSPMSWAARIKVALDIARGIEYLHVYAVPRIIHRDIKPLNIFLDATLTAKLSNFGLSVEAPVDDWSGYGCETVVGTYGYMAPDYVCGNLTTKVDVYSFGVVLLEMLSGLKANSTIENDEKICITQFLAPYIAQKEIHKFLDPNVPPPTPLEMEALANVAFLALDCVIENPVLRPSMTKVANTIQSTLEGILEGQVIAYHSIACNLSTLEGILVGQVIAYNPIACNSISDSEIDAEESIIDAEGSISDSEIEPR